MKSLIDRFKKLPLRTKVWMIHWICILAIWFVILYYIAFFLAAAFPLLEARINYAIVTACSGGIIAVYNYFSIRIWRLNQNE